MSYSNQISANFDPSLYQGGWDADTNTPTITSGSGVQGHYYIVTVPGNTIIDGNTDWHIGDWIVFNGLTWDKVDMPAETLNSLEDVEAPTPAGGDVLIYDLGSSKWKNQPLPSGTTYWNRVGTTLMPLNIGDDVDFGSGILFDQFVTSGIPLGELGETALDITFSAISLVGALNELKGDITPGGVNGNIQFNDSGVLGGSDQYVIDSSDVNASKIRAVSPDGTKNIQISVDQLWNVGSVYTLADTLELWAAGFKQVSLTNIEMLLEKIFRLKANAIPAAPASDSMNMYVKASGSTPNREVAYCVKDEQNNEIILHSILV